MRFGKLQTGFAFALGFHYLCHDEEEIQAMFDARLNTMRHILSMLLAAASLCLLSAGGVSCVNGRAEAGVAGVLPADTMALVEGLRLFEEERYDLARRQLIESASTQNPYIRAESFLYLNALEMELGNYGAARPWLERYHVEAMRLMRRAVDAEREMTEQAARLRRRHDLLIGGMIFLGVMLVAALLLFTRRRWGMGVLRARKQPGEESGKESGERSTAGWQTDPGRDDPHTTPHSPHPLRSAAESDISEWKPYLIDAEIFKQTAIYAEIAELARQRPGREARVLPAVRQQVLETELAGRFSDFTARLRADYPALTAGDLKLCCLSLLPLSSFARALCFGSTETNIVKQRKHNIKKKMGSGGRDRALFEFIFSVRS